METQGKDPSQSSRGKTDESLKTERSKTDEYLDKKSEQVTANAEETIRLNRAAADRRREQSRAEADSDKTESRLNATPQQSLKADDKTLDRERERADSAQDVERAKEDRVREKERFQKRLIVEALLDAERNETDSNLRDERALLDLDSEQSSHRLSDEKNSHGETKRALVTRDQFLAVVSHDLKNPLGTISMSAGLMRRALSKGELDTDQLSTYLGVVERSAAIMDRLITDLLDVERMGSAKLTLKTERTDICDLLQECKDLFAPIAASKTFSMTIESCPEQLCADVDYDRVLQVLSNLMGNAMKFTPQGGKIGLFAKQNGDHIEISVSDNGPGIPEEKKTKIFERFSQLQSNDRRGLGLGLFISKWIVEAHKGRIWVTSEPGKGSTFTFTLPLTVSH